MGRPQPEPSLYEDVGATEVSQLATEWRERLGWSQANDEDELTPDEVAMEDQPQVTLGAEPSHRLIPAVGIGRLPSGPELRPVGEAKSSLPGVAALPAPGQPRQSQKFALVPPASRVSPEPPIALPRPSQKSKQLPVVAASSRASAQLPVVAAASRVSAQLPVVGSPQRRSGQLAAAAPSRISGVLPELAPPPRSSDPSIPGAPMSLRRGSESSKSLAVEVKDDKDDKDAKDAKDRKIVMLALAGVALLSVSANLFSLFRGPAPWRTAPVVAAAAPAAVRAPAAASSAPSLAACLRESSQTITSDERDELLLRAVQAFENGKQDQASNLFQRYMHEACDAATLEAVTILSQQREPASDGKGASR